MGIGQRNKYHTKKVTIDGYKFDSIMEADRYCELKMLEKAKVIHGLEIHPSFMLQEHFRHDGRWERAITYEADFRYVEGGRVVVEDVKGMKTDVYKIKRKLFLKRYGDEVIFKEVTKNELR